MAICRILAFVNTFLTLDGSLVQDYLELMSKTQFLLLQSLS